jgi:hypothetical protein
MVTTVPSRSFVPTDLRLTDFALIQPLYQELRDRSINSEKELEIHQHELPYR